MVALAAGRLIGSRPRAYMFPLWGASPSPQLVRSYRGTGSAGYHPALLLGLLVYGYATGVLIFGRLAHTVDSE
jgi:hypothetical protein